VDKAPPKPGAYELANNRGGIQYIGKASNLKQRLQQHLMDPTKAPRVGKIRYAQDKDPAALERQLIRRYQELHGGRLPPLNEQKPQSPTIPE
jgi:excinuclease UvrABC nuclease subunit